MIREHYPAVDEKTERLFQTNILSTLECQLKMGDSFWDAMAQEEWLPDLLPLFPHVQKAFAEHKKRIKTEFLRDFVANELSKKQ